MKRLWVVFILVLAFCGIAVATYLTQHEISGVPLVCNIGNLSGCNVVATSPYARLFGIPIAEYGILFYGILFALASLELVVFDRLLRRALQIASTIGVLASLSFILVQIFLIGALCEYCLASAFIALLIFIFASLIEPMSLGRRDKAPSPPYPTVLAPPGA